MALTARADDRQAFGDDDEIADAIFGKLETGAGSVAFKYELDPSQRARGIAVRHAVEAHDWTVVGSRAPDDLDVAVAGADDDADLQERGPRVEDVEGAVEAVRAAHAAAGKPVLGRTGHVSRRCRRARGGSP